VSLLPKASLRIAQNRAAAARADGLVPREHFRQNVDVKFLSLQRPRIDEITDLPGICLLYMLPFKNYQTQDSVLFACSGAVFS